MIVQRAYVYRLEPTPEQEQFLSQVAGACRALYNLALEQRMKWGRPGRPIRLAAQSRELTELRKEIDWMADAPVQALQSTLMDLDRAFENYFSGRSDHPKFRRKGDGDGFRLRDKNRIGFKRVNRRKGALRIQKIGWVKLSGWRPLGGELRNVTIKQRRGKWYASVMWRSEIPDPPRRELPPVGIDCGVTVFATTSGGVKRRSPRTLKTIEVKITVARGKLARRTYGSFNWKKQKRKVSSLIAKYNNIRNDFLHKLSLDFAKSHGMVAIERLQIRSMLRSNSSSSLNKAVLAQGWGIFRDYLSYKVPALGGELVEVPPNFTSQKCSECGFVSRESRVSQASFRCVSCGHKAHADTNAAINILRAGLARRACGSNHSGGRKQEPSDHQTIRLMTEPRGRTRGEANRETRNCLL